MGLATCSMGEFNKLFIVPGLVLGSHLVIRIFLFPVHVRPLCAHMFHNFIRGPVRVKIFKFLSVLLAEVYVRAERFFGSSDFSLGSHIRA